LKAADLNWINGFFRETGPYLFLREEDGVVILPPNQVYKANASGISILRHMQRSGSITGLPGLADGERADQVDAFFRDLRDFCAGDTRGMDGRSSVERVPFTFQYTTLPILGEIAITYRCNNACMFCYAGCGAPQGCGASQGRGAPGAREAGGPDMSLGEIKRVIRIFKEEARIPFFSFTGGEPTLRPDLEKMIRYACGLGLRVNLITNATLIDAARAASLKRSGLGTAQVSVEADTAALHDTLTAAPGSFERTLEGIRHLQEAGISVQTNTTLTAPNAGAAPRMPGFLKGLGIGRFAMNLYIPQAAVPDPLLLPYAAVGPVVEQVRGAARAAGLTFFWYSPTPHCIYNPVARGLGNKSCAAMDGLLSVSPAGDVLPCSSYPQPMGNLLAESFRQIWFSSRAQHFKNKEYAPPECGGCESFTACQAACPLYWQRAGTGEIRNPAVCGRAAAVR
jgi:radical SAM protein with 4Fe4S-binding SPASM domain